MNPNDLAVHGGPRAVSTEYKEGWRQVRTSDLKPILAAARNDVNTEAKGEGPIAEFERQFAQLTGSRYALTMNSGTAALHSAYFALGVKPGTEVIVPGYTFFATAAPILQCGGRPVFCDVDPETLVADPDDVERRITPRTRAICVVHLWGNPAPMDRFVEIARRHNLGLIEDCSHAHGALYRNRAVGSWGHIGCFSLQGPKAVSAGEGGIAVTDDPVLFDRMLALGHYGRLKAGQANNTFDTDFLSLGVKYRPHLYGIHLAIASLSRLPELNRRRQRNYDILCEELAGCEAVQPIKTTPEAVRGGFLEFIVRYTPEKAGNWKSTEFIKAAQAEGVPISKERYAQLGKSRRMLSETPIFTTLDSSELGGYMEASRAAQDSPASPELPVVKSLAGRLLTLPPFTKVSERFVRECAAALRKVAECAAARGQDPAPRGQAA
ncbi:MAG TPA: DegT/DnrJ/EryC1/StrS family aminotransferase [Verrucomicrobiae bacterium]|nr:DegT/DnrJ/EryC1/StrS family aminotransferase [Verrucomicrobiae bacterium]